VDIDFGDVSIAMRNLLRKQGKQRFNPGTAASMFFLNATDPTTIKLAAVMLEWGYKGSAWGHPSGLGKVRRPRRPPPAADRSGAGDHFINRRCLRRKGHRALDMGPPHCDHPRPEAHTSESGGVLLQAAAQGDCSPDGTRRHALEGVADGTAGYLCGWQRGSGSSTRPRRSSRTTACCSRVATLNYADIRRGELRRLLRPARGYDGLPGCRISASITF
jgi:hypothetical protein